MTRYLSDSLIFALLFPLVIYSQSDPSAGDTTPGSPIVFEPEIRAFLSQDSASFPPPGAYLFTGSSTIRKWEDLASDFKEIRVIRRGFGGSTMKDLNYYARDIVLPYKPAVIVVYEGDNDLSDGQDPGAFIAQCDTFIRTVHRALPDTRIYFLSVKPSFARIGMLPLQDEANIRLKKLARHSPKTRFIDIRQSMYDPGGHLRKELFEPDSLHINRECYSLWTSRIKASLGIAR